MLRFVGKPKVAKRGLWRLRAPWQTIFLFAFFGAIVSVTVHHQLRRSGDKTRTDEEELEFLLCLEVGRLRRELREFLVLTPSCVDQRGISVTE